MPRVFILKRNNNEIELSDPNIDLPPKAVRDLYSATYPELTTATFEGPVPKDGKLIFKFVPTIGTKG